jgi:hypothetical protein
MVHDDFSGVEISIARCVAEMVGVSPASHFFIFLFYFMCICLRYNNSMHRDDMAERNPHHAPWEKANPPSPSGMEPTAHLALSPNVSSRTYIIYIRGRKERQQSKQEEEGKTERRHLNRSQKRSK